MNVNEALNVLNISGASFSQDEIKTAYRRAAAKYHPDKAGEADKAAYTEIMKAINAAYAFLSSLGDTIHVNMDEAHFYDYSEVLKSVLDQLYMMDGLLIEICGNWIWITGETKKHKDVLGKNGLGCFYASKKQAWYYRPEEHKGRGRGKTLSMDEIREKYGSDQKKSQGKTRLYGSNAKKAGFPVAMA